MTTARVRQYAQEAEQAHMAPVGSVLSKGHLMVTVRARKDVARRLRDDGFSLTQVGRWLRCSEATILRAQRVPG